MANNPLEYKDKVPTKEDLEDYLGPGRFRRFDSVYEEIIDLDFDAKLLWSKHDKSWFHRFFYKGKTALFDIIFGHDFFYTLLVIDKKKYLKITNDKAVTQYALELVRKFPENRMKETVRVEANMEKMNEQEAFFDLLPLLIKYLA